jgi:hypothetical protein
MTRGLYIALAAAALCMTAVSGCAPKYVQGEHIRSYRLMSPAPSADTEYEDDNLWVRLGVAEDKAFGIELENNTDRPMRVFWRNSLVVGVSGSDQPLGYIITELGGNADADGVTMIRPGGDIVAQVFPAANRYTREDGTRALYPLYYDGPAGGRPESLRDTPIGIKLVVEANGGTRLYKFMLLVEPGGQGT